MATSLVDDIDGTGPATTRRFSLDGNLYEIDLNEVNYGILKSFLDSYVSYARRIDNRSKRKNYAPTVPKEDRNKIRAWAAANGRNVPLRGRFPADLVRDYYANLKADPKDYIFIETN